MLLSHELEERELVKKFFMDTLQPNEDLSDCYDVTLEEPEIMTDKIFEFYNVNSVASLMGLLHIDQKEHKIVFCKEVVSDFIAEVKEFVTNVPTIPILRTSYRIDCFRDEFLVNTLINFLNADSLISCATKNTEGFHFEYKLAIAILQSLSTNRYDLGKNILYVNKDNILEYGLDRIVTDLVHDYFPTPDLREIFIKYIVLLKKTIEGVGLDNPFIVFSEYRSWTMNGSSRVPLFHCLDGKYKNLLMEVIYANTSLS